MRVRVLIYKAKEGGYWAQIPALPGCITEGETREEVIANLREALAGCLLTPRGDFVPEEEARKRRSRFEIHGNRTLKTGTQRNIMKQAGLTEDDL